MKNKELKIIIINPEELDKAKEEFTKNVLIAYEQKKIIINNKG